MITAIFSIPVIIWLRKRRKINIRDCRTWVYSLTNMLSKNKDFLIRIFFLFLLLTYHIGYLIFFFSVDGVILNTSKKIIRCVSVLAYLTHFLEMLPLCVNPTEYSRFFSLVRASLFFFFFPIFCLLQFFSARFFPYSLSLLADGRILHSAFFLWNHRC